jgi:hypothetical protein
MRREREREGNRSSESRKETGAPVIEGFAERDDANVGGGIDVRRGERQQTCGEKR